MANLVHLETGRSHPPIPWRHIPIRRVQIPIRTGHPVIHIGHGVLRQIRDNNAECNDDDAQIRKKSRKRKTGALSRHTGDAVADLDGILTAYSRQKIVDQPGSGGGGGLGTGDGHGTACGAYTGALAG